MKWVTAGWLFMVFWATCAAQIQDSHAQAALSGTYAIPGKTVIDQYKNKVEGTPFIYEQWGKGNVVLQNGRKLTGLALQFNQLTNALWYRLGDTLYVFTDTVKQARIEFSVRESPVWVTLRSHYPPADGHSLNALYEVVEDGATLQLLRFTRKEIVDGADKGAPMRMQYKARDTYYLFDVRQQEIFAIPATLNWRKIPLNLNVLINQYTLGHGDPENIGDWINCVRWINDRP